MSSSAKPILNKTGFLKMATSIAMPIMIQNLINTMVNSADTLMLGYVGQDAMAASSLANQLTFVLFCAFFGLTAGASVMASQYFGKKDKETIERVMGLGMRFSLLISFLFFIAGFFFPELVMRAFTAEEPLIYEGARYLRIISISFVFMGFSQIYLCVLRSTERLTLPSVTYVISLLVNVFLNAAFIFGFWFFPKLGLVGVAIGTVAARITEFLICVIHSMLSKEMKFRVRYVFSKAGILMKDFLSLSIPSMVNDVTWSLANTAYSMIMGHLGSDAVAANAVAVMVVNIGAIVCRGFANATTVIVSKALGEDNREAAKVYAGRLFYITLVVSLAGGLVMLAIRPFILSIYQDKLTENALILLSTMMIFQIFRLLGEGINTWMICGCFRGGGDSKYGMKLDMIFMWLVSVPLMYVAAFILNLPVIWVYLVMCLDEWYKMLPSALHYRSFTWLQNITRDKSELTE